MGERFSEHEWVFDLVSPEQRRRAAALRRHHRLIDDGFGDALRREMARESSIFGPLDDFMAQPDDVEAGRFAVLYLQWERAFPDEWRGAGLWSPWTRKEVLLKRLAGSPVPTELRDGIAGALLAAVRGPYRCKDWLFAPVAARVDGPVLESGLEACLGSDDPLIRLRAGYTLHLASEPEHPSNRHRFRRWAAAGHDDNIRRATSVEAGAVRALVQDAYAHYVPRIGLRPAPMDADYEALTSAGQVWILPDDASELDDANGPAAVIVLSDEGRDLLIENVAVATEMQGRGLGRRMLAFAEAEGRCRGRHRVKLYTHQDMTENIALYKSLGYRETERRAEHGFARVFMSKPIGSS